jgi:hypothetical protein
VDSAPPSLSDPPDREHGASSNAAAALSERPTRPFAVSGPPRLQLAFGARLTATPEIDKPPQPPQMAAWEQRAGDSRASEQPVVEQTVSVKARAARAVAEDAADLRQSPEQSGLAAGPPDRTQSAPAVEVEPHRTAAPDKAAHPTPAREAPAAPPLARDIRVEVAGGGDRKVEVRLVERAGEVHFAVRTPDDRLAGNLREHLPLLSTRLEQSGFRADGWHTNAGGSERRLELDAAAAGSGENQDPGRRQNGDQHHGGERRHERPEQPVPADEKGTVFEWLMTSLQ